MKNTLKAATPARRKTAKKLGNKKVVKKVAKVVGRKGASKTDIARMKEFQMLLAPHVKTQAEANAVASLSKPTRKSTAKKVGLSEGKLSQLEEWGWSKGFRIVLGTRQTDSCPARFDRRSLASINRIIDGQKRVRSA